jgi:hypothetical protein
MDRVRSEGEGEGEGKGEREKGEGEGEREVEDEGKGEGEGEEDERFFLKGCELSTQHKNGRESSRMGTLLLLFFRLYFCHHN